MTKQFNKALRIVRGGVLIVAIMSICGCGHKGPRIVNVTGTVTSEGKPVPNLTLYFQPEKGRPSWGHTDGAGRYTLKYNKEFDGAVTGKHTVWVQFLSRGPMEEIQGTTAVLTASLKKYGSMETTPLWFEIATDNQVIDIKLEPSKE